MEKITCKLPFSHYIATACIFWCFDDRFTQALEDYVVEKGYKPFDLVRIAGGALVLANPDDPGFETALRQIEISLTLHHAERVVLMMHQDCGAVGGSKSFADHEVEEKALTDTLNQAKKNVEELLSSMGKENIPVDIVLVDIH